ncbi:MAG: FAD-binding protein [Chloroflexi bacterium]|nr:FAD-binding protein [Chloroflexota bacterium]
MDKTIITRDLAQIVGGKFVLTHPDDLRVYSYDASNNTALPDFVVLPETTDQVSRIVKIARAHGLAIVPRGAGTGFCGGAIPVAGGVMIGFARMKKVIEVDLPNRVAIVEPGLINLDLSNAVAGDGYFYAPDPSSQAACTIGGNVASNSGGPHCLAYGVTANHILGLEVVLEDGTILWIGGKSPDEPGYDLVGAFIGSEGTFGIITKIMARLVPSPEAVRTLLAIFNTVEQASRAVGAIIAAGVIPAALEMMDATTMQAVEAAYHLGYPDDAGALLLIEVDGPREGLDDLTNIINDICREFDAREIRAARTAEERARLWMGRKNAIGALGRLAPNYYLQDGVVPRSKLPEVLAKQDALAKKYGLPIANVFHAGDGNLHPNILFDMKKPGEYAIVRKLGGEILKLCVDAGGTISGEHGIGIEKLEYMPLLFSEADLNEMRKLRAAIAPSQILNPCKMIPEGSRCGEVMRGQLAAGVAASGDVWV